MSRITFPLTLPAILALLFLSPTLSAQVSTKRAAMNGFVAIPLNLGTETDKVFLSLYLTGLRGVLPSSGVTIEVGGVAVPVTYVGV